MKKNVVAFSCFIISCFFVTDTFGVDIGDVTNAVKNEAKNQVQRGVSNAIEGATKGISEKISGLKAKAQQATEKVASAKSLLSKAANVKNLAMEKIASAKKTLTNAKSLAETAKGVAADSQQNVLEAKKTEEVAIKDFELAQKVAASPMADSIEKRKADTAKKAVEAAKANVVATENEAKQKTEKSEQATIAEKEAEKEVEGAKTELSTAEKEEIVAKEKLTAAEEEEKEAKNAIENAEEETGKTGYSLMDALKSAQNVENSDNPLEVPKYMPGITEKKNGGAADFTGRLQNIINGLSGIAGGVAVLFIVVNAIRLVFAVGGADEISKAKKGLTWSLAGLVLIIFAYIIAKTVITLTYSGENFGTHEDPPAVEKVVAVAEEPDLICETNIDQAEKSCYEWKGGAMKQSKKPGSCSMEQSSVQSKVCESMKLSKHMTEEVKCNLENIQKALISGYYYEEKDVKNGWANPDGKYGMATERALKAYYQSKCDGTTGNAPTGNATSAEK